MSFFDVIERKQENVETHTEKFVAGLCILLELNANLKITATFDEIELYPFYYLETPQKQRDSLEAMGWYFDSSSWALPLERI